MCRVKFHIMGTYQQTTNNKTKASYTQQGNETTEFSCLGCSEILKAHLLDPGTKMRVSILPTHGGGPLWPFHLARLLGSDSRQYQYQYQYQKSKKS